MGSSSNGTARTEAVGGQATGTTGCNIAGDTGSGGIAHLVVLRVLAFAVAGVKAVTGTGVIFSVCKELQQTCTLEALLKLFDAQYTVFLCRVMWITINNNRCGTTRLDDINCRSQKGATEMMV